VATDPNPYKSPNAAEHAETEAQEERRGVAFSLFMIVVGAFFFVVSFYVVLGHGIDALLSSYHKIGRFSFAFMVFYGFVGGFTSVFHLSYLVRGWPKQHSAGMYAIAVALCLAGLAVALMDRIT
jgi:hypothetical protein